MGLAVVRFPCFPNNESVEQTTARAFPPLVLPVSMPTVFPEDLTLLWLRLGITRISRFPQKEHGFQLCHETTTNRRSLRTLNNGRQPSHGDVKGARPMV